MTEVVVHVSHLRPVRGRDKVRYEATALVEIAGVQVLLYSVTLRDEGGGKHGCYMPQSRCSDGIWRPAVKLPVEIEQMIGEELLKETGGMVVTYPIQEHENG